MLCLIVDLWGSSNYFFIKNYITGVSNANGKTIQAVVISDLRDHQFGSNNKKLVDKIAGIEPDVIFMDGDMLNAESDNASAPCDLFRKSFRFIMLFAIAKTGISAMDIWIL